MPSFVDACAQAPDLGSQTIVMEGVAALAEEVLNQACRILLAELLEKAARTDHFVDTLGTLADDGALFDVVLTVEDEHVASLEDECGKHAGLEVVTDVCYKSFQLLALLARFAAFKKSACRFLADEHQVYYDLDMLYDDFDLREFDPDRFPCFDDDPEPDF